MCVADVEGFVGLTQYPGIYVNAGLQDLTLALTRPDPSSHVANIKFGKVCMRSMQMLCEESNIYRDNR